MKIRSGFDPEDHSLAAALYLEAFGQKLALTLGPKEKALKFLERVMQSDHALSAYSETGALIGLVGFKTYEGALVGGTFNDLRAVFGIFGATWRAGLLSLLERDIDNARFLMDGIFVTEYARGHGVGKMLLAAIKNEASARGYDEIRLDVIDGNPRARALYERSGFTPIAEQRLGPLKWIFRFKSATTMVAQVR